MEERREPPPPLPLNVTFTPEEKGVESLARQIRLTGRAYPLFDVAQLVLKRPERFVVELTVKKDAEGKIIQPLFLCSLDDTVWLSVDEAVRYVLRRHFETFYQAERTPTDPPKGTYTFVAQCGLSGVVLGPPNYHDYQSKLTKLHAERFSRMPFDVFKSKVRIVRDEAVVKKWVDDQSWKTEFNCLNLPEPLRLGSREEVDRHFRETHCANIISEVERVSLVTQVSRSESAPALVGFLRRGLDDQRRFPLRVVTTLSQQFASHGLQFFKVNKTITHVAVARPRYLDLEITPVSDGVRKIVELIHNQPGCTRRKLMDLLAPSAPVAPAPAPAPAAEGQPAEPPAAPEPTAEQTVVVSDLHWLIHQGHVIEFANGALELAKKPLPKPPKPEPKPAAAAPQPPASTPEATPAPAAAPAPAAEAATEINEPAPSTGVAAPAPAPEPTPATPGPATEAPSA
jgi:hypothetical protein